ncbi:MAG: sensor histidine kinase [Actinomycetota bacterium]|nr:sensor histidine kinase [Actinomycetota bacterium]
MDGTAERAAGRRPPPLVVDSLLAVTLAALTWGTMVLDECRCPMPGWTGLVVAGQTLPLALRRQAPVPVWLFIGLMTGIHGASDLDDPALFFGGLVAVYTVASRSSRRTSYVVAAVTAVAMLLAIWAAGDTPFVTAAFQYVVFGAAWILGDSVRVHRAYTAELEQRAARLEREREEEASRAAAAERVRIARELHDVVAHHVSVIALQSQAAEVLLRTDADRAAAVMSDIGANARQASAELRRLLGALREEADDPPLLAPQPGVGEVEGLVESVRRAGLAVEVSVEGERRPLPAGVGLSAYRIVQEALTNVLKHAHARRAEVRLVYGERDLVVEVSDDGTASPGNGSGPGEGHGLIGMRERVSVYGGQLRAGPRPEGGFAVKARLPLAEA